MENNAEIRHIVKKYDKGVFFFEWVMV